MGSLASPSKQSTAATATLSMSIFKALLLSALAVTAKAAPTEVVAGRVVTHAAPSLHTLHSSPFHHAVRGVQAVQLVHHAVPQPPQAPAVTEVRLVEPEDAEPAAQYNFGYSITDSVTGDFKSRQESRDGDVVSGSYSVADPDGRIRTVTYTADDVHGFQATVTYVGQPGPVAVPFNAPSKAVERSEPLPAVSIVEAPQAVRTVPVVRTIPTLQDVQALHNIRNTLTAVRTVPALQDVHAVHNLGHAVTAVRTVPTLQDVHAVNNLEHANEVTALRTTQAVPADNN